MMKCIVGLGNPGGKYVRTRHNVGFMVVDALSKAWQVPLNQEKYRALYGETRVGQERVLLLKPQTFMNRSGESLAELLRYNDCGVDELVVVYDDMDLPLGALRLRLKGSAGGHNGMKSIIHHLGTEEFKRLRVGIGRPPHGDVISYVLQPFAKEEQKSLEEVVENCVAALHHWLTNPFEETMNRFNR